jgi:EAL domain-containing protein (putative c-di-GMP-specific phosphodiesterase class I)
MPFGYLAVNLSAHQFRRSDLTGIVKRILAETALPPEYLELDITESCLLEQGTQVETHLKGLIDLGLQLSVDHFGTGYSSLAYLKRLPLHRLKVDRSFIRDIPDDANDVAIASTVIGMAHALGLQALAAGVETEAQLAFLKEQRCEAFQGHLCSEALSAEAFVRRGLRC